MLHCTSKGWEQFTPLFYQGCISKKVILSINGLSNPLAPMVSTIYLGLQCFWGTAQVSHFFERDLVIMVCTLKANLIICTSRLHTKSMQRCELGNIRLNRVFYASWKISTRAGNLHDALLRKPIGKELIDMSGLTRPVVSEKTMLLFMRVLWKTSRK